MHGMETAMDDDDDDEIEQQLSSMMKGRRRVVEGHTTGAAGGASVSGDKLERVCQTLYNFVVKLSFFLLSDFQCFYFIENHE